MSTDQNSETGARLRERKLRHLYELVDCENNKKVLTEVDRLLKKQPDFPCAKTLKALALIRMGKVVEAREILDLVVSEVPTDDGTIQALSICFKELDDQPTMCKVLEAASKKLPSEELMTHCFMAQVRTNEYTKQQLTALNLYKMYAKPTYFGWAVASLLIKAKNLPPNDSGRALSLTLAERMLSKFLGDLEKDQVEESILLLYLETLSKQKKWEEVLTTLKNYIGYPNPASAWNNDYFYEVYTQALMELGKKNELFNYLQSSYFKNTEEYHLIHRIITLFKDDKQIGPEVNSLLKELLTNFPSHVSALSDLHYANATFNSGDSQSDFISRVRNDLEMACKYGASKPSFYTDIIRFVNSDLLGEEVKQEFMKMIGTSKEYNSIQSIIRDVNYELIERDLFPDPNPKARIARAERLVEKYFRGESVASSLRSGTESDSNLITKEADYHDQFLVIAASSLMAKYDDEINDFQGVLEEMRNGRVELDGVENLKLEDEANQEENEDKNYNLSDQECLLMLSIMLMEFGLKRCPFNHSLRILLIKAYTRIGAIQRACMVSTGLDIKHVQWDSLGYLVIWKVVRGGLYAISRQMLTVAESVYTNYKRDCMEHLISAYKFGSFGKIQEFEEFREQLLNSCQFGLIQVERMLLQIGSTTLSGSGSNSNPALNVSPYRAAKSFDFENEKGGVFWSQREFTDNRDFTLLQYLERESGNRPLENVKKASGETDINQLKIRRALLVLLTEMIVIVEENKEGDGKLARIDEAIKNIRENLDSLSKLKGKREDVPNFDGLWPPPQLQYVEMGCLSLVLELVGVVRQAITEPSSGGGDTGSCLVLMSDKITSFSTGVKGRLQEKLGKLSILMMGGVIEDIHHVVETLSFASILFDVAQKALKNLEDRKAKALASPPSSSSKKKKKGAPDPKTKATSTPPPDLSSLRQAHTSLRDLIIALRGADICSYPPATWNVAKKEWKGVISQKLIESVFSPFWDEVQHGIVDSYGLQLDQFVKAIDNNFKFISKIESGGAGQGH
ncbi:unnamed protein product [Orchesella dallaii]|uniref:N-terminal acetyltransferase B complex subunit MDM20 homolog n=1 Tax=Orchesella dallaii TaxID=48710 RepID=A0ABP1QXY7_9HEXA